MGLTYKDSGVDIEKGNSFVKRIIPSVKATFSDRVLTGIGGFGALFSGSFPDMKDPVLVSGTDGVGTKLTIARMTGIHNTIGIDAVAMCVNDILTSGASPLFFLDYISCGKLDEEVLVNVVQGIAEGCSQAGCSLIGGETAEHPNVMNEEEYDIASFAVGVVDKPDIITGETIKAGDMVIGLPSSGIHSNGYSLVRKLFFDIKKYPVSKKLEDLPGTLGDVLLTPTRIYCKSIQHALASGVSIKGMVHVTGGGFYENIPRILPDSTSVKIDTSSFEVPPIFRVIQREGNVAEKEMFTTFNMGIGMIMFTAKDQCDSLMNALKESGEQPKILGEVVAQDAAGGERVVMK